MTRYEAIQRRLATYPLPKKSATIVAELREHVPQTREAKPKEDTRPTFDASAWHPSAAALELLARVERRNNPNSPIEGETVAERNERIYGGMGDSYVDRITDSYQSRIGNTQDRYNALESGRGTNGSCHSRKTTYRHHKYGSGALSRKGYLKQPIKNNPKGKEA